MRHALAEDEHLRNGLNVHQGKITCRAVAEVLQLPYTPASDALGMSELSPSALMTCEKGAICGSS